MLDFLTFIMPWFNNRFKGVGMQRTSIFLHVQAMSCKLILAMVMMATVSVAQAQIPSAPINNPISGQGNWEITLQGRDLDGNLSNGYEAYYDTALNITWMGNALYGATSPKAFNGAMRAIDAVNWVNSLSDGGVTGWRLPAMYGASHGCYSSSSPCPAPQNTVDVSEMAHLYYRTLGNKDTGQAWPLGSETINTGPFANVARGTFYFWTRVYQESKSNVTPSTLGVMFGFDMGKGMQNQGLASYGSLGAWAVHDGDVGVVPEPQTCVLMLLGMGSMMFVAKRKRVIAD